MQEHEILLCTHICLFLSKADFLPRLFYLNRHAPPCFCLGSHMDDIASTDGFSHMVSLVLMCGALLDPFDGDPFGSSGMVLITSFAFFV